MNPQPPPPADPHPPAPQPNADPFLESQLTLTGKGYGLMYSVWGRFRDIIGEGPSFLECNPSFLSPRDRAYREEYINLLSIEPKISDLVRERPLMQLASQLERGRNQFRSAEVHVIARDIPTWGIGVPEGKQLRGFGNDICGRLLCPSTCDWDDAETRHKIKNHDILVTHDDFPRFLWENERVDEEDMKKGFLRGNVLVKVVLAILIAPSAARPDGQSSGAGGYADRLNLQTLTIGSLAFAATVARFALSADSKCLWSAKTGVGFNNISLYHRIVSTFKSWTEEEQRSLIIWWNRKVLSRLRGGIHAGAFNDAPAPGSAAAIMLQQAANANAGFH